MERSSNSIQETRAAVASRKVRAEDLVAAALERIRAQDGEIGAFVTLTEERALKRARALDEAAAHGKELPPLTGAICSVKDAILVEGARCTASSRMLENYVAPYQATAVDRLEAAGGIVIGKTNMDEFGMGTSTENSAFGPTRNPRDPSRVAGGSSGGAAASVAADMCDAALGADTGGSIRLPASFCGVVGVKPTYGSVSRSGLIALASSLDQIGPLARNIADAEAVFAAICGRDSFDSTSTEYEHRSKDVSLRGLRVGIPEEYAGEGLDPAVGRVVQSILERMKDAGATLVPVSLPNTAFGLAAYYMINTSEVSSNLARYDGIRYGASSREGESIRERYERTRGELFGPEVKRRVMLGAYALSAGYADEHYRRAQRIRTLLKEDFEKAFASADIIAGPVSPVLPFLLGEKIDDPLAMYLVDTYTVPVNLVGLPALSMPAGQAETLPVGLHLIAPPMGEPLLFGTGRAVESLRDTA